MTVFTASVLYFYLLFHVYIFLCFLINELLFCLLLQVMSFNLIYLSLCFVCSVSSIPYLFLYCRLPINIRICLFSYKDLHVFLHLHLCLFCHSFFFLFFSSLNIYSLSFKIVTISLSLYLPSLCLCKIIRRKVQQESLPPPAHSTPWYAPSKCTRMKWPV
jgi:hypothetical protein